MEEYLIAAIVGAIAGLLTSGLTGWWMAYRADTERRRQHFAEALAVVSEYYEFPYVIRRRGSCHQEAERLRISTELRAVQQKIAFHQGWLRTESVQVADAYDQLVSEMRRVAGGQMHEAWKSTPIETDAEMNISGIDRGQFEQFRVAYLDAARQRCSWRRGFRWARPWKK